MKKPASLVTALSALAFVVLGILGLWLWRERRE
jgi:hypothetical protein